MLIFLLGELHRADNRATTPEYVQKSRDAIISHFLSNGYPRTSIYWTLSLFQYRKRTKNESHPPTDTRSDKRIFIRAPFVTETHKRRYKSLLRRSGLSDHI